MIALCVNLTWCEVSFVKEFCAHMRIWRARYVLTLMKLVECVTAISA